MEPHVDDATGDGGNAETIRRIEKQFPLSSSSSIDAPSEKNGNPDRERELAEAPLSPTSPMDGSFDKHLAPSDEPAEKAAFELDKRPSFSSSSSSEAPSEDKNGHLDHWREPFESLTSPSDKSLENHMPPSDEPSENAAPELVKKPSLSSSSSSEADSEESLFQLDVAELRDPAAAEQASDGARHSTEAKADAWVAWPDQDEGNTTFFSFAQCTDGDSDTGGAAPALTQAPDIQTMSKPAGDAFDLNRIPSSVFVTNSTMPADWSVASNESLFSIHAGRSGDLTALYSNGSHFEYFYDAAMQGCSEPDWRLPAVPETSELDDASRPSDASGLAGKDLAVPDSTRSAASRIGGGKKAVNDSASNRSSTSDQSFAFPILPETTSSPQTNSLPYKQLRPEEAAATEAVQAQTAQKRRCTFACFWPSCCRCCYCSWGVCRWRCCCHCRWCF